MATSSKNTPKKKEQATCEDAYTRESSNVGAIEVLLLKEKKKSRLRQRGISTTSIEGGIDHHPHNNSCSGYKS
jgi:hypothetical protein